MIKFLKLTTMFQPGEYGKPNRSSKYFMDYTFYVVRFFPKGIFPRATFQVATSQMCNLPSDNFPKVRLGLLRHRRLQ